METSREIRALEPTLANAFAPIHKRALGVAVGLTSGCLMALITLRHLIIQSQPSPPIALLARFFYGYTVTWSGVIVGFAWAFAVGFVLGWSLAFLRNVFTALWVLSIRTKSALSGPFLDQI